MRSGFERLAPADEANLVLDRAGQVNVFLVACVLGPGGFVDAGTGPDLTALRAALAPRIERLPPLRRTVVRDGRGHRWSDADADLEHHVRMIDVPDGPHALEQVCGHLMTVALDRRRPLWELLVLPHTERAQTAVILRIHHVLADGMAAVAIVQSLFDDEQGDPPRRASVPAPKRSRLARAVYGLKRVRLTLTGRELGATMFLGERTDDRRVDFVDVDVASLLARMRPRGATVNDGVLAAVAAGYRAAMTAVGEPIPETFPVSVPVALERHGAARNQVGVMLIRLPLIVGDPDERLRMIVEQSRSEKMTARDQGTLEFLRGPVGARIMTRLAARQRLVGGFVTDVHGPDRAQRLAGAPIERIWPVAVLAANVRLCVGALSVGGRLGLGIHSDAAHVPGAPFADALRKELARLTL